ncbi:MAG: hypothetical protein LH629_14065 [Ignavibacteria bacterium]|nr:hypothetical protein [Ignavibacteria bacterium]
MKAQKITREVIENLPSGKYVIFKNGILDNILEVVNTNGKVFENIDDSNYGGLYVLNYKDFMNDDCYIILASEVKLNQYSCPNDIGVC